MNTDDVYTHFKRIALKYGAKHYNSYTYEIHPLKLHIWYVDGFIRKELYYNA